MANLTITGAVTRTELGLADLVLNDDTYKIVRQGFGPGEVTWDRKYTGSPFVHGQLLTNAKRSQVTSPLWVRVKGASGADVQSKMEDLARAFDQFRYYLSMTIEGTTYTWLCNPADYSIGDGGSFNSFHLMANQEVIQFAVPRYPITFAGPF